MQRHAGGTSAICNQKVNCCDVPRTGPPAPCGDLQAGAGVTTLPNPAALHGWPTEPKSKNASRDRFRHNLARVMAEQGVTQAGLARALEVSRVAVHAWIWGTCFPETSRLIKLAQVLNVPIGALLEVDAGPAQTPLPSNEEVLLLNAFRKLPNTARLTLLADAYEMTTRTLPEAPRTAES